MKLKALFAAVAIAASSQAMANTDNVTIQYIADANHGLHLNIIEDTVTLDAATGIGNVTFCVGTTAPAKPAAYSILFDSANSLTLVQGSNSMDYTATLKDGNSTPDLPLVDGGKEMDQDEITLNTGTANCGAADHTIEIGANTAQAVAGLTYADQIDLTISAD